MPCKYHSYIPFDEINILLIDIPLSKAIKIPIFALARVAHYTLVSTRKFNTELTPDGALCQLDTHAKLFIGFFFLNRGGGSIPTTSGMSLWEWLN